MGKIRTSFYGFYKNLGQNTLPFRAGMNAPVPKARIMLECPAWE